MSDDIFIRIKTLLEKATDAELKKVEQDIQQRVNPKIKIDVDSQNLNKASEKYVDMQNSVSGITQRTKEWVTSTGEIVKQTEMLKAGTTEISKRITDTTIDYKKQRDEIAKVNAEQSKYWAERRKETISGMTSKPDELVKMANYYRELEATSDAFNTKNINAIDYEIQQREIQGQQFSKALQAKMLQNVEENKITDEIRKQSLAQQDLLNKIRGMRGIDGKFIVGDNLNALNQLESQITGFDPTNKNFKKNMDEANSKLKQISTTTSIYKKEIQDANKYTGLFGQSILEAGKKFASWLLIGNVIMGVAGAVRNGIQYITDIDTALTNLNKVTDETKETLKDFSIEANSIGRELAKTTIDVINSTTEFARLGFSLQQSTQLAKQALLYSNVGDIGVEQASLAIISAVKGFGVEVDSTGRNVQKIVDIYNEVGNNFAISSAGIGEAMRRSSASLYAAGNTMEEAVALITAANSVVQDPAAVGGYAPLYSDI